MKFGIVEISGFAGISASERLDLSADVVILQGANGLGKSTICDAIAWCLSGTHPRGADPRSLYSATGETHVAVELRDSDAGSWTVRRKITNPEVDRAAQLESAVVVEGSGQYFRGGEAEAWLIRSLLRAPDSAPAEAFRLLVDAYYLQQESLREFLVGRSDDERFAALSTMVGAGALDDFVRAFDTARRAWSRSLKEQQIQLEDLDGRVAAARARCEVLDAELNGAGRIRLSDERDRWLAAVLDKLRATGFPRPEDFGLDAAMGLLRELDSGLRRDVEALRLALADFEGGEAPELPEILDFNQVALDEAAAAVLDAEAERERASEAVREARRALQVQRAERDDLVGLATIALRHIGSECPTCGQAVDADELRRRLEGLLAESPVDPLGDALELALRLEQERDQRLRARVGELVRLQGEADVQRRAVAAHLAHVERQREAFARLRGVLESVAPRVGRLEAADFDDDGGRARVIIDRLQELQAELSALLAQGGAIDAQLRSAVEVGALRATQAQVQELEIGREGLASDVSERQVTATFAEILMREMKRDSEAFVNSRLREMQPLLDQLYGAIEPHPTFRHLALETRNWYGKNRLDAVARDVAQGVTMNEPGRSLSTSQANAMAVAVFLAFNLGLAPTALEVVVLDDPLQNLDDVHLLGLVDLLRRITSQRQIIVTTHDRHFGALLARKLRPIDESRRVSTVDIVSWDRSGPTLGVAQVEPDLVPMKLAPAVA